MQGLSAGRGYAPLLGTYIFLPVTKPGLQRSSICCIYAFTPSFHSKGFLVARAKRSFSVPKYFILGQAVEDVFPSMFFRVPPQAPLGTKKQVSFTDPVWWFVTAVCGHEACWSGPADILA